MIDPALIDEGYTKLAAASRSPWSVEYDSDGDECRDYGRWPCEIVGPKSTSPYGTNRVSEIADMTPADAELIAYMRNTIADLLDTARTLERVREALSDHPRCEKHPDDDEVKCGWKRAVASVQLALEEGDDQRSRAV
jgi:hypothetical protein